MIEEVAAAPRVWPRVKWTRAAQLGPLLGDTLALDTVGAMTPSTAFSVLRKDDAVGAARFIAQCLPRVDAVRWVLQCITEAAANPPPARAVAAKAVRRWVAHPSDEGRRLAYDAGDIAGWDTMEGLACLAVFLSGGSMAPAAQEIPVNPQPGLFGKVVAGAVIAAAQAHGGAGFADRIAAMLAQGDAIAAGEQPA